MAHKILQLRLNQIRLDGDTQSRVELDSGTASEYAESYRQNEVFPEPVVFHDGSSYWLADGFHRWHGMNQAKIKCASFKVFSGTKRDAFLFAVGTNQKHGKRRSSADIRHCVRRMLEDEEWGKWVNAEIARQCKTHPHLVADEKKKLHEERKRKEEQKKRREEEAAGTTPHYVGAQSEDSAPPPPPVPETRRTYTTKHGTTATMDTSNIGKAQGYRERPAYLIREDKEPEAYADKEEQLNRSRKKHARQSLEIGETEEEAVARFLEVRRSIPVVED